MNITNYIWGPNDASIQFCEDKYKQVFWIAEYYNTISSISYIIIGSLNKSKIGTINPINGPAIYHARGSFVIVRFLIYGNGFKDLNLCSYTRYFIWIYC